MIDPVLVLLGLLTFLVGLAIGWSLSQLVRIDNARLRAELAHQQRTFPSSSRCWTTRRRSSRRRSTRSPAQRCEPAPRSSSSWPIRSSATSRRTRSAEIGKRQQALDELIKPIRDALTQVDRKLGESDAGAVETTTLLKELNQQQERLRGETQNLVRALRTPSVRGRWGEMQLRRVVELAGMLPYCDFDEQPSLLAEFGRQRPDLIVKLPGGRTIVVDAKVPLEAYLDAQEARTTRRAQARMADHARQVREHMTKLGAKSYWEQVQPSPEFVVMFLPGESFFQSALQHDVELIDYGVRSRRSFRPAPSR